MSKTIAPPHNLWKVARLDAMRLNADERATLIAWVAESSGLSADEISARVLPTALITQAEEGGTYRLHISRFVTDDEGRLIIDHALDEGALQTEPLVYVIPAVPDWVLPLYQQQLNTMGGQ